MTDRRFTYFGDSQDIAFMNILVNGEAKDVEESLTVQDLLHSMNLRTDRVAVEINLKILDRSDFSVWNLKDGDKVEILSFIGGGSPS